MATSRKKQSIYFLYPHLFFLFFFFLHSRWYNLKGMPFHLLSEYWGWTKYNWEIQQWAMMVIWWFEQFLAKMKAWASNLEVNQPYKIIRNAIHAKIELENGSIGSDLLWLHDPGVLEWLCDSHWCFADTNKQGVSSAWERVIAARC